MAPVWTFLASMVTPGMTAPVPSATVPVIVPRSVCANRLVEDSKRHAMTNRLRIFMMYSSLSAMFWKYDHNLLVTRRGLCDRNSQMQHLAARKNTQRRSSKFFVENSGVTLSPSFVDSQSKSSWGELH